MELAGLTETLPGLSSVDDKAKKPSGWREKIKQTGSPCSSLDLITLYEHPEPTVE
jgi:hypothetical protein